MKSESVLTRVLPFEGETEGMSPLPSFEEEFSEDFRYELTIIQGIMPQRRIIPYNSELKPLARRLRKNMTPAEKRLWQRIRRKQILGYSFYRQRPIDQYIVDFYCPDLLLAIEVDGRSHDGKLEEDLHRQRRLESLGIHILRFSDQEIIHDMENVLRAITGWITEHTQETSP